MSKMLMTLKIILLIVTVSIFITACGKETIRSLPDENKASIFASKTYFLGKVPDSDREMAFQEHVIKSADIAVKQNPILNKIKVGFNYLITPKGAVYPFSEVEVACLIQSRYVKEYGKLLCDDFFSNIDKKFPPIKE